VKGATTRFVSDHATAAAAFAEIDRLCQRWANKRTSDAVEWLLVGADTGLVCRPEIQ
jgi:hypothetical protein